MGTALFLLTWVRTGRHGVTPQHPKIMPETLPGGDMRVDDHISPDSACDHNITAAAGEVDREFDI